MNWKIEYDGVCDAIHTAIENGIDSLELDKAQDETIDRLRAEGYIITQNNEGYIIDF